LDAYGYENPRGAVPSTMVVLIQKPDVSVLQASMQRLQGSMFGTIFPYIVQERFLHQADELDECPTSMFALRGIILWVFEFLAHFVRLGGGEYMVVAKILSVFGAKSLIQPCPSSATDPRGAFVKVQGITEAIFLMLTIEMTVPPQVSASDIVKQELEAYMDVLEMDFTNVLNGRAQERDVHNSFNDKMARLLTMGVEAGKEPRLGRRPWDANLLKKVTDDLDAMSAYLIGIEFAFKTDDTIISARDSPGKMAPVRALDWLTKEQNWNILKDDFLTTLGLVKEILLATFHHETEEPLDLSDFGKRLETLETLDGVDRFRTTIKMKPLSAEVRTLEEDEATRLGNILLTLRRAFNCQAKIITDCTSSIDIDLT
jgi:hypothetical protein